MSAAKHTPGPLAVIASASGKPLIVADHPHHDGDIARMARDTPEAWATAALFAAAPELLEVARLLALATDEGDDAAQGTHYVDKTGRIRCKGSFLETIEKARAAIAKATGDTQ